MSTYTEKNFNDLKLCFILASNNKQNAQDFVERIQPLLEQTQSEVIVVASGMRFDNFKIPSRVRVISSPIEGVSYARNIGIDEAIKTGQIYDFVVFPNDRSDYPIESVMSLSALTKSKEVQIGSWKSPDGKYFLIPRKNYDTEIAFLSIYEPSVAVPWFIFHLSIRFRSDIGTGSSSSIQSGEGAFLLQDIHKLGIGINQALGFWAVNPHTIITQSSEAPRDKISRYAPGVIHYIESINSKRYKKISYEIASCISPIVRFVLGQDYWRETGIRLTFIAMIGRVRHLVRVNTLVFQSKFSILFIRKENLK